jgi:hypothetical protein
MTPWHATETAYRETQRRDTAALMHAARRAATHPHPTLAPEERWRALRRWAASLGGVRPPRKNV